METPGAHARLFLPASACRRGGQEGQGRGGVAPEAHHVHSARQPSDLGQADGGRCARTWLRGHRAARRHARQPHRPRASRGALDLGGGKCVRGQRRRHLVGLDALRQSRWLKEARLHARRDHCAPQELRGFPRSASRAAALRLRLDHAHTALGRGVGIGRAGLLQELRRGHLSLHAPDGQAGSRRTDVQGKEGICLLERADSRKVHERLDEPPHEEFRGERKTHRLYEERRL